MPITASPPAYYGMYEPRAHTPVGPVMARTAAVEWMPEPSEVRRGFLSSPPLLPFSDASAYCLLLP